MADKCLVLRGKGGHWGTRAPCISSCSGTSLHDNPRYANIIEEINSGLFMLHQFIVLYCRTANI